MEFCLVLFRAERLSSLHGKHDVDVDFGVGVRHRRVPINMQDLYRPPYSVG